jgi:hypothetical protein
MWMAPPYVTPLKKWLEKLVSKCKSQGLILSPKKTKLFIRYSSGYLVQSMHLGCRRWVSRHSFLSPQHRHRAIYH